MADTESPLALHSVTSEAFLRGIKELLSLSTPNEALEASGKLNLRQPTPEIFGVRLECVGEASAEGGAQLKC